MYSPAYDGWCYTPPQAHPSIFIPNPNYQPHSPWVTNAPLWHPQTPLQPQTPYQPQTPFQSQSPFRPHTPFQPQTPFQGPGGPISPIANRPRSSKYPNLHPMLAMDTSLLRIDLKMNPSTYASIYLTYGSELALANNTRRMRLISKDFPWQCDVTPINGNVTCFDVWKILYEQLQQPIVDSEWGFIVKEKDALERVEKAMKKRLEALPSSSRTPLRIDYLGEATQFRGLEKDDDYKKKRYLPGPLSPPADETWVVKLTT